MNAYYNEIDPYAAQWLRNLIAAGHIAPGDVDERSIADVRADDLRGYTQAHFFAGIGIWSAALRDAGWPDDRPVWTGSCPCQPLSAAGKGLGTRDPRHLWPVWFELIRNCRPLAVFGEQVASNDGLAWLDIVCADLEGESYPVWPVDLCAAGVGAPHIRQRLWWMAHPDGRHPGAERLQRGWEQRQQPQDGRALRMANTGCAGAGRHARTGAPAQAEGDREWLADGSDASDVLIACRPTRRLANADQGGFGGDRIEAEGRDGQPYAQQRLATCELGDAERGGCERRQPTWGGAGAALPSGVNGFWGSADWIACTDGRARPVEAGTFPLAHGLPRSMGRLGPELGRLAKVAGLHGRSLARAKSYRVHGLRGYGNAINREAAAAFIRAAAGITVTDGPLEQK